MGQALIENFAQTITLHLVAEPRIERVNVDRQAMLAPQVIPAVLEARCDGLVGQAQLFRQRLDEASGVGAGVGRGLALISETIRVMPDGLPVLAPKNRERPARQLLARIPLALAEVQEAAVAVFGAQLLHQRVGIAAFGRPLRVGIPLGGIAILVGNKGRLPPHRQAHITGGQIAINAFAEIEHPLPLLFGVRLGHARRFVDAGDAHVMLEFHLAFVDAAFNRCSGRGLRCAGQRDVALASKQARRRIKADPAGTGQIHLAPGMQVGEIFGRAARPVERFDISGELNQIAGNKTCRKAKMAHQLHQQPAGITAGTGGKRQRLLRRLHARLHADQVADVVVEHRIDVDQKINGAASALVYFFQILIDQRRHGCCDQVRRKLGLRLGAVGERELFC